MLGELLGQAPGMKRPMQATILCNSTSTDHFLNSTNKIGTFWLRSLYPLTFVAISRACDMQAAKRCTRQTQQGLAPQQCQAMNPQETTGPSQ